LLHKPFFRLRVQRAGRFVQQQDSGPCCAGSAPRDHDALTVARPTALPHRAAAGPTRVFQTSAPALGRESERHERRSSSLCSSFSVTSRRPKTMFSQPGFHQTPVLLRHDRNNAAHVGNVHVSQKATPAIVTLPSCGSIKRVNSVKDWSDLPAPMPRQAPRSRLQQHACSRSSRNLWLRRKDRLTPSQRDMGGVVAQHPDWWRLRFCTGCPQPLEPVPKRCAAVCHSPLIRAQTAQRVKG